MQFLKCLSKACNVLIIFIFFFTEVESKKYTSVLHGIIGGVPVPFPVSQGLISGPINANSKIVYLNALKVEQSYPKVNLMYNMHYFCLFYMHLIIVPIFCTIENVYIKMTINYQTLGPVYYVFTEY